MNGPMKSEPRQMTEQETRDHFLEECRAIVEYWTGPSARGDTEKRVSGAVFSILAMFDGEGQGIPWSVRPAVGPEYIQDRKDEGSNWVGDYDVAREGSLHQEFCAPEAARNERKRAEMMAGNEVATDLIMFTDLLIEHGLATTTAQAEEMLSCSDVDIDDLHYCNDTKFSRAKLCGKVLTVTPYRGNTNPVVRHLA